MASYAHYALQKLHILPSQFMELDRADKAFIIASIDLRVEAEKKEAKKAQKKQGARYGNHIITDSVI